MGRKWLWLLVALLAGLVWPVSGGAQPLARAAPAAGRDTVVIGTAQEPDTLNPVFLESGTALRVVQTIFTEDVTRDARSMFAQGVAYLPSVQDGTWQVRGERMSLRWKIKPRVWHDGRPVTCSDYVFSHQVARDERIHIAAGTGDMTKRIASVACPGGPGATEVVVNWKERYAYANRGVTEFGALPRHVLEHFYRANPGTLHQIPYGREPEATIGDGAYRLVAWRHGDSVTVESVGPHPIFGTPKIKRIIWRLFRGDEDLVAGMVAGTVDVISVPGVRFDLATALDRQASAGRFTVHRTPWLFWEHIDFNLDNPLLRDVRVRRAIAHGINRTQMVQRLFGAWQPVSHSYLPTQHPGYTGNVRRYSYDPARARALLQQAGFTPDPDGIMRNAAGQRLSLELSTTAGNPLREQIEQIIQEQLRQVGIEISILNFPFRAFFGEITGRRRFKAMALYTWILSPTSDCDTLYTSDGIPNEANAWSGQNFPGYTNPEMDRICKSIIREVDEEKRTRLLQESARIFADDLPALPLFFRVLVHAAKNGLVNYSVGFAYHELPSEVWNAHQWYWE